MYSVRRNTPQSILEAKGPSQRQSGKSSIIHLSTGWAVECNLRSIGLFITDCRSYFATRLSVGRATGKITKPKEQVRVTSDQAEKLSDTSSWNRVRRGSGRSRNVATGFHRQYCGLAVDWFEAVPLWFGQLVYLQVSGNRLFR